MGSIVADSSHLEARSFGKIAVAAPGTPVRVTSDANLRVSRLRFAAVVGEVGRVFVGVAGVNKANGTGVIKEFWPTGAGGGVADEFVIDSPAGELRPADYYIDANTAGEGLIVAYWIWVPSFNS
jgi:hypothetical protein